jgi:hypothetical protein
MSQTKSVLELATSVTKTTCVCLAIGLLFGLAANKEANGQTPYTKHALVRSDMPPGLAAESYRLANPELSHHVQPVRVIVPMGARIEVGVQGAFVESFSSRSTVGLMVGPVYRMKVTRIPRHFGKDLYPSIEILDKLNPPTGLEGEFPIQVNISQDDLEQALEGRMVTKVIYLENPEHALPHRHEEDKQPYFDVGGGEDPLRAAERLGRPMAILRIGSRQPTFTQDDSGFSFFGPSPIMLSDPQSVETVHDWDGVEQMQMPERYSPPSIRGEVQPNNVIANSIVPNANMSGEVPPMRMPQRDLQMQNPPVQIPAVNVPPIVPGSSR